MGVQILNWKLVISALISLAFWAQDSCLADDFAVSPVDGSVWMTTSSEGLLRFGRNGRSIRYTAEDGQLSSNQISSLAFDASGVLYLLDAEGVLIRYSSTDGFTPVSKAELPVSVSEAFFGPSEIETPEVSVVPEEPVTSGGRSFPGWLWLVLGALLGVGATLLFTRTRAKASSEVVPVKKTAPVVPAPVAKPAPAAPAPAPKPAPVAAPAPVVAATPEDSPELSIEEALQRSPFGRQVWDLLVDHLSNSAYGVEEVARDLDLSRIHVNRKLKAETGYSPSAVFKFIRMNHASKLLLEGELPVAEVAQACGFASASYFSTAFKDYYHQSPSEFLSQHNQPA